MAIFPSMKARALLRVLYRELGYSVVRQKGSHRRLESTRFPHSPLTVSFHDRDTVPPGLVRKILVDQVGLNEKEARDLL